MVKKIVILSSQQIEYVESIAKLVSDKRAKNGNFSRGLRLIIDEHKKIREKKIG